MRLRLHGRAGVVAGALNGIFAQASRLGLAALRRAGAFVGERLLRVVQG